MAINDIVQTIAEARIDARSLSEFVFKPAGFKVARRLAPPVDTLQFYINRFNSLNGDFSSSVSVALSSLNSSVAEADGKVAYIETTVQDAINDTILSSGFVIIDSFELGATLTQRNQALRHAVDGRLYRWAGDLPKVVSTNSTPTSSGGMGDNAWLEVSDITLRQDLANPTIGAAMVGRGVVAVDSIADLVALPEGQRKEGLRYLVTSYHAGWAVKVPYLGPRGGGEFVYDSSRAGENDGGVVLDGFVRVYDKTVELEWYPNVHLGSADDLTLAVAACTAGGTIEIPPGESPLDLSVNCLIEKDITLNGNGRELSGAGRISYEGDYTILSAGFASTASAGDFTISLTDASSIESGDFLLLIDSAEYSFSNYRPYYHEGEAVIVDSVSGNTVSLQSRLIVGGYGPDLKFIIVKIDPVRPVVNDLSVTGTGIKMSLLHTLNPVLDNVHLRSSTGSNPLSVWNCKDLTVDNSSVVNTNEDPLYFGYGAAWRGVYDAVIRGSFFYARRHASAIGAAGEVKTPPSRNVNFYICEFVSFGNAGNTHAADIHGIAVDVYFHDCIADGGVVLGGQDVAWFGGKIYSNTAQGPMYFRELVRGSAKFVGAKVVNRSSEPMSSTHSSSEHDRPRGDIDILIDCDMVQPAGVSNNFSYPHISLEEDKVLSYTVRGKLDNAGVNRCVFITAAAVEGAKVGHVDISGLEIQNVPSSCRLIDVGPNAVSESTTVSTQEWTMDIDVTGVPSGQGYAQINLPAGRVPTKSVTSSLIFRSGNDLGLFGTVSIFGRDSGGFVTYGRVMVSDPMGTLTESRSIPVTVTIGAKKAKYSLS